MKSITALHGSLFMKFTRQKIQQDRDIGGTRIDNPSIQRYNGSQRPGIFVSEDQALECLASILVDEFVRQKRKSHA
ncbi:MAG: hypothetical protein AAB681_03090 [Patescibacteria group bacterium]